MIRAAYVVGTETGPVGVGSDQGRTRYQFSAAVSAGLA
jgi:hypothetical protein